MYLVKLIMNVGWFIYVIVSIVLCCRQTKALNKLTRKINSVKSQAQYWLSPHGKESNEEEEQDMEPEIVESGETQDEPMTPIQKLREEVRRKKEQSKRKSSGVSTKVPIISYIVIFAFLLPLVLSKPFTVPHPDGHMNNCVDGLSIPSSATTCNVINSTFENCTTSFDLTFTIPFAGGALCSKLLDAGGNLVGSVVVGYIGLEAVLHTTVDYYTSKWQLAYQSAQHCYDWTNPQLCNHHCDDCHDSICPRNAFNTLSAPGVTSYSGKSTCDRTVGGPLVGCLFVDPACVFSGYGIIPEGEPVEVRSISTTTFKPVMGFAVGLTDDNSDGIQWNGFLDAPVTQSGVRLEQIGVFNIGQLGFGQRKLIRNGTRSVLMEASPKDAPISGAIGDIQAPGVLDITSPSLNLKFSTELVKKSLQLKTATYSASSPGIHAYYHVPSDQVLPNVFDGNIWYDDLGTLSSNLTVTPPALFRIRTLHPVTYVRQVIIVCPVFVVWIADGLYSDPRGCSVLINASSSCADGFVHVTADKSYIDIHSEVVNLATSTYTIAVRFGTDRAANDFSLCLHGNSHTACHQVQFTAKQNVSLDPNGDQPANPAIPNPNAGDSLWTAFWNWVAKTIDQFFTGKLAWWGTAIGIVLVIVAVAFVVVTILAGAIALLAILSPYLAPILSGFISAKTISRIGDAGQKVKNT
jgi:hypothetical protein